MKLHKNWEVTPVGLGKLHSLSDEDLKKEIESKHLFAGLSKDFATKENAKIYGKINNSRTDKKARQADASKNKKRNRKDSKDRSKSSK